jgi:hypothetical protein
MGQAPILFKVGVIIQNEKHSKQWQIKKKRRL